MIKALFFDIDGTLIDHAAGGPGVMPASTLACLQAARRKGIQLYVATGRPLEMVHFLEAYFPFDGFVAFNGQLAVTREGEVLHRLPHHPEDIRKLVELVRADPFPCLIQEQEEKFYVSYFPIMAEHYRWACLPVPQGPYDLRRLETVPVLQFLAYIPFAEAQQRLSPLEHIEITSAGGEILDVIPKAGGKEVGIAAVAARYGWNREEIMVFGDGQNDARMLRWAGIGVALGNGVPAAKEAADFVTTPIGEDGVLQALLHYHILTPEEVHLPPQKEA